jgi:hypothetical protein
MIQELDLVFLGNKKGFLPKAIRFITGFEYNHVGIVVKYLDKLYVLEAKARGFHPTLSLDNWIKEKSERGDRVAILRDKNNSSKEAVYGRLEKIAGNNYEFLNLLFFQIIKIVTGRWLGSKDSSTVICSEAVAYAYKDYFDNPYEATPVEIFYNDNFKLICTIN